MVKSNNNEARHSRVIFTALIAVLLVVTAGQLNAEVIFFANGRTMSVKDYRVEGDTITVTLRQGGQATFDRALIARIGPDELPPVDEAAAVPKMAQVIEPIVRQSLDGKPFAELIDAVATKHGIDPALVHAVIEAESNYRPTATSHVGARGLMQLMPSTARELGVKSARRLFDPEENVETGVRYLKFLLQRFNGDLPTALAAYNAGPGAVSKYDGIPPYPETRNYVRKVLSNFQQ